MVLSGFAVVGNAQGHNRVPWDATGRVCSSGDGQGTTVCQGMLLGGLCLLLGGFAPVGMAKAQPCAKGCYWAGCCVGFTKGSYYYLNPLEYPRLMPDGIDFDIF